jgi:putative ABC transport system permease protein
MIRNYLKIAFRSLWRSKLHSVINVSGLSIGIAVCILIVLFVRDELTFDRFHSKAERIYRAYVIENWGENQVFIDMVTPFPLGPALRDNLEEVESMVRVNNVGTQIKTDKELFSERVMIAGADFFNMFDFSVVRGEKMGILNDQTSIVLTEESAKRFFGGEDPVGKTLSVQLNDRFEDFTVRGVVQNPPINSSIQFSILISDLNYPKLYSERALTSGWFNITPETYVLLKEGADVNKVTAKFPSIFKPLLGERGRIMKKVSMPFFFSH